MRIFSVPEAKAHLSSLLDAVQAGEDVLIARAGRPVARLTGRLEEKRPIGMDDGAILIPLDFDRWIPDEFQPYL